MEPIDLGCHRRHRHRHRHRHHHHNHHHHHSAVKQATTNFLQGQRCEASKATASACRLFSVSLAAL